MTTYTTTGHQSNNDHIP